MEGDGMTGLVVVMRRARAKMCATTLRSGHKSGHTAFFRALFQSLFHQLFP